MTTELQQLEAKLMGEINKLRQELARHTHNGFDSGRRLVKPIIAQGIEVEAPVDPSIASFTILAGDGFGMTIDANVGASIYGLTTITGQSSYIQVGGTTTNGEVGLYDASGSSSKYFKLAHSSNGDPVIITDALPTSSAGLAAGTLWSDSGTVKIV